MKSLLICPAERERVAALAEDVPLALLPLCGKPLVEYWLEHLLAAGAREVLVLNTDRTPKVLARVGDGARWGLKLTVQNEVIEHTAAEVRTKFKAADNSNWLPGPNDVIVMDRLPDQPEFPLFTDYAGWFAALLDHLPRAATPDRIGIRVLKLGVWAGLHTRIAPTAELHAPCWIGENVHIGDGAVVGPNVIVEANSFIEPRAKVCDSYVGPGTFVGAFTDVEQSIALGNTLVSWKYDSVLKVPDEFLLSSLDPARIAAQAAAAGNLFPSRQSQPAWSWKFNAKTEL